MKQKERYTLQELYDDLPITLTELSKLTGKSHGTLTRIRSGEPTRRSTINKLLIILSEIYNLDLSLGNVTGIVLEERQEQAAQKTKKPSASKSTRAISDKPQKRKYKPRETALPEGCILASEFAEKHGINRTTFIAHMDRGLGPGLIGMSTDTIPQRDQVAYSERDHPSRKGEKERYLTQEQQTAALDFWRRHGIEFTMPETEKEHAQ